MIRSTAVNRLVLGAGLLFLACAAAILAGYLLNPADVRFPIGPIAFFTILGGCWCCAPMPWSGSFRARPDRGRSA